MNKQEREDKKLKAAKAKEHLLSILKPGDSVYTILRRRGSSGMNRDISLAIVDKTDMTIRDISFHAAQVLGLAMNRDNGGIKCSGCGMDMGFHLVYELGSRLWRDGTGEAHGTRNGSPDTHGGYALNHHWI